MPIKTFLVISAFVISAIGLTLVFFPTFVANFFLPAPARESAVFIRYLGSALVGYSYLNWFTAMHHLTVDEMRPALMANLSTLSLALFISVVDVLRHDLKNTGLFIILLHLVFAVGFAYYLFPRRKRN